MKHKIKALCFAVITALSVVLGSVSAFAAINEASGASEFIEDVFSDWEEAGDQAVALRDAYYNFLVACTQPEDLKQLLGEGLQIPIAWLRATKAGVYALSPLDNIYYWLTNNKLIFDDRTSGQSVKKTIEQDVEDPTIYLPKPWIQIIKPSSGGSSDLKGIISDVSTGVGGVFSMSKSGFDFITGNDLCMFMVAISFAGVGLGLIGRAFKTSRK